MLFTANKFIHIHIPYCGKDLLKWSKLHSHSMLSVAFGIAILQSKNNIPLYIKVLLICAAFSFLFFFWLLCVIIFFCSFTCPFTTVQQILSSMALVYANICEIELLRFLLLKVDRSSPSFNSMYATWRYNRLPVSPRECFLLSPINLLVKLLIYWNMVLVVIQWLG